MNLERSAARAKFLITLVALLGVVIALIGGVMVSKASRPITPQITRQAVSEPSQTGNAAYPPTTSTITMMNPMLLPAMSIFLFGLLILCMTALIGPMTMLHFRRAQDEKWRYEQLIGALENQRQVLEVVKEGASLSDAAKQIAYRHKDREALFKAIHEDLEKQDYEAANSLMEEMERRFGYRQEAAQMREQITTARRTNIENKVREGIGTIDHLSSRFDWIGAQREADKLLRLFPERPDVRRLPERIQTSRDTHKRDLLKEWKDAVARDDVDRSVELLRQLDQYLSPGEAEGYKEAARDVFKKKLQQLGVQFALHVHDRNWSEALRIGQQISDEYPNTRIAAEVKERLPILKEKALQPAAV